MDKIVIEGGKRLEGTVKISGAKNAVLPVLAATLLTKGRNIIKGVPKVRDVATMIRLLEGLGAEVESYRNEKIILDHGIEVGKELANVLSGGNTTIDKTLREDDLYKLELESFMRLIETKKTQKRIKHTLATGKPLVN